VGFGALVTRGFSDAIRGMRDVFRQRLRVVSAALDAVAARVPMHKPNLRFMKHPLRRLALPAVLFWATAVHAQFSMVPSPQTPASVRESAAEIEKEYRIDAARHLYANYPGRIYKGKLPPLIYSVMVVETEIDAAGQVLNVSVVRKPAAPEVAPWVITMIRRAAPFPAPAKLPDGAVKYVDIWLVDKSGQFQVDTLTEGQR
jgi:periplasmic protein TonB